MSTYKLTYFNCRGRAELIRLVFVAAGVPYEDVRIEYTSTEAWPALKPKTPFGQLPILEVDGVKLCQTNTIARYLARKFNLAGKTELDQARADMIVDCIQDILTPLLTFHFEKDEARKNKYIEEQLPKCLTLLEGILKTNNGGDGFCVGDGLTWADLCILTTCDWMKVVGTEAEFAKNPKLDALSQRVAKVPKVPEWLAKRPVTEF